MKRLLQIIGSIFAFSIIIATLEEPEPDPIVYPDDAPTLDPNREAIGYDWDTGDYIYADSIKEDESRKP